MPKKPKPRPKPPKKPKYRSLIQLSKLMGQALMESYPSDLLRSLEPKSGPSEA